MGSLEKHFTARGSIILNTTVGGRVPVPDPDLAPGVRAKSGTSDAVSSFFYEMPPSTKSFDVLARLD